MLICSACGKKFFAKPQIMSFIMHFSICMVPVMPVFPSCILMSASALNGMSAIFAVISCTRMAKTLSFGKPTDALMSTGMFILPNERVANRVLACALTSRCFPCSWIWSLSSPRATVSRPALPATIMLSIESPNFPRCILPVWSLPLRATCLMSTIVNKVSAQSV